MLFISGQEAEQGVGGERAKRPTRTTREALQDPQRGEGLAEEQDHLQGKAAVRGLKLGRQERKHFQNFFQEEPQLPREGGQDEKQVHFQSGGGSERWGTIQVTIHTVPCFLLKNT